MSELWTDPDLGPYPSSHLVVHEFTSRGGMEMVAIRCSHWRAITPDQRAACTDEPPATSRGPTCEHCLRLANRDHRNPPEDDGSTQPETVP